MLKPGSSMMAEMIQVNDVTSGWKEMAQETAVRHLAIKGDVRGCSNRWEVLYYKAKPLNQPKPTPKHYHFPNLTGWEGMTVRAALPEPFPSSGPALPVANDEIWWVSSEW